MTFPKTVLEVIDQADREEPGSAQAAIELAVARVRTMQEFPNIVDDLINTAIGELLYRVRQSRNVRIKAQNGAYVAPPKVKIGESESVQRVAESYYDYAIGGKYLGLIRGDELQDLAATESAQANGHRFNSRLLVKLRTKVRDHQLVQEAISERQLATLFAETKRELSK